MANFGIGLGAFMGGLNQGLETGQRIKGIRQQREVEDASSKAFEQAKGMRESDIAKRIEVAGIGEGPDAPREYRVGNQYFGDEKSARGAAEKEVDSVMAYYNRVGAPMIRDTYLKQGRVQEAQAWDKWIQDEQVQTGMRHWASALRAAQQGDPDKFVASMMKMYNTPGYYEDGVTATDSKAIKDKGGAITGYEITFKDNKSGKSTTQRIGMEELYQVGLGLGAPDQVFKQGLAELQRAQQLRADIAKEDRKFARDVQLESVKQRGRIEAEGIKQNNKLEQISTKAQLDRAMQTEGFQKKVEFLKSQGYDDAFIRENAPAIAGIKQSDPSELRRRLHASRMQGDFRYAGRTPEEQAAIIENDLNVIGAAQPQQAGALAPAPAGPQRGTPVLDTKTGRVIYR